MNLNPLIKELTKLSKRTDPWAFNKLNNVQKEMLVKKAIKDSNYAPNQPANATDKVLKQNIANRLNDAKTMDYIRNYNSKGLLDARADKFLAENADKISKDLEDYTTIPLDYEDKYNRVNLSKFVDENELELPQNEALDNLLYEEGLETVNRGTADDELIEAIQEQRKNSTSNAWKHLDNESTKPGSLTVYSRTQSYPYKSEWGNQYLPFDYYQGRQNYPELTANQRYINKKLDDLNKNSFEYNYNRFDEKDPLNEQIDPYTGLKQNVESTDDSFLRDEITRRLYRSLHQNDINPEVLKELYELNR